MTKKSFSASVLPQMRAFAAKLIGRNDCVLVGLSGGADSVCLLHFLQYLAKEKHFALAAVHINHQLRGRAALKDQHFCEQLCKTLDIDLFVVQVDAKKVTQELDLSPEHGARKARYEALLQIARKWGATKVALGHHLDDQTETILLNLLRGTKAKGLTGIPVRRPLADGIEIIRPLLCITRAETEAYLAQNHLTHVTDQTNFEDVFTRNWIRNELLPLLEKKQPQFKKHLLAMSQEIDSLLKNQNQTPPIWYYMSMGSIVLSFAQKNHLTLKGLTFRSQEVEKGFAFFALKGANADGNLFSEEAVKRGAALLVSAQAPARDFGVPYLQVADIDKEMADCAYEFYGKPSDQLTLFGITGTKGKTSIAYLLEQILTQNGQTCGVFGTVNYRVGGQKICDAPNTTPASLTLFKLLRQMKERGASDIVMEVSSHSLELQRVRNIWYDTAIFTNLQRDHLDFHKTFENYFQAKVKLFKNVADSNNPKPNRAIIVNADDPYGVRLIEAFKNRVRICTFGLTSAADFTATDIEESLTQTRFKINGVPMHINLLGRHNVYNALAACACAHSRGVSLQTIAQGLAALPGVPGRMEQIQQGQPFTVFVDFAYTDESLQRAFATVKPFQQGRIFLVFGCGGQRDRTKRPLMGKTACSQADYVFLTNDNPRCEDPNQIFDDILKGMGGFSNYQIVPDRKSAIEQALAQARPNDIVIIAGKGHEDYQLVGTEKRHFSDQETVRSFLRGKYVSFK